MMSKPIGLAAAPINASAEAEVVSAVRLNVASANAGETDSLCLSLQKLSELFGHPLPAEAFAESAARDTQGNVVLGDILQNLHMLGFQAHFLERPLSAIPEEAFPVILVRPAGNTVLLQKRLLSDDQCYEVWWPKLGGGTNASMKDPAEQGNVGILLVKPPLHTATARGLDVQSQSKTGWFWKVLWRYRGYYAEAAVGTVLINLLALVASFFSMTVYDKILPNEAYVSLWTLAIGAWVAGIFEFLLRNLRAWVVDRGGQKADLVISSILFRHSMALRMEARPGSSGAYANNMGSFETLREFFSSATTLALADLPFVFLFIAVIALLSGPLWIVPAVAIPVLLCAGLIAQIPLRHLTDAYMREAGDKHGLLVESIEGLESIKAACAEGLMVRRWDDVNAQASQLSSKSRFIVSLIGTFSSHVQQIATMALVIWGVYLINAGELTMGGLIAATILCGRALSPLSSVLSLAGRWQQSRSSLDALSLLMKRPTEREAGKSYSILRRVHGRVALNNVHFSYPQGERPSLTGVSLVVEAGQRVALVGSVGSGKSTLLRLAAGYYWSSEGLVTLDNIDLKQVDPALLRQHMVLMGQDARLFRGSLRDNLAMGQASVDEAIFEVLESLGLLEWINSLPDGLDSKIGESGAGLSGGQRQLLALARLMLSNPSVVLLDEPTSALDQRTEQRVVEALRLWLGSRTLLLATHRPGLLELTDTIVAMGKGTILEVGGRER